MYNNELYHYGRKGMKWGQHIFGKRPSRTQRDARKLVDASTKYYDAVNRRNANYDIGYSTEKDDKDIVKYERSAQKIVKKLERRYSSVSAIPKFESNGYIVKSVEAMVTKMDRQGRQTSIAKSYNPVKTYNSWRKQADPEIMTKVDSINTKYWDKYYSTKDSKKRELIEKERLEKVNKLLDDSEMKDPAKLIKREQAVKARIEAKYVKKIKNAKTQEEREALEFDMMDELDNYRYW